MGFCMSQAENITASANGAEDASPLTLSTVTETGAWIVQGVAPEDDQCRMTDEGDAVWYARTVNEYLNETIAEETPLNELMREAVYTASDLYSAKVDDLMDIDLTTLPSAMVSCVRWDEYTGEVEYFNIGDCVSLVSTAHGDHRICATDASLSKSGFDANDQWRLAFSPEAIDYARSGTLPDHDVTNIHLFTTAADAAVEIYGLYESWGQFQSKIEAGGPSDVVDDINTLYNDSADINTIAERPGVQDLSLLSISFD